LETFIWDEANQIHICFKSL